MKVVAAALLALVSLPVMASAEKQRERPNTDVSADSADKNVIRQAVRDHEADPLSKEARTKLAPMLLAHFEDMPYVVCLDQVPGLESEGKFGKALLWQMVFGTGMFIEQNPGRAADREAYMLAGLQSAVRAYRNVRAKDPKKTIALFEELDDMEQHGKLREHVHAHACVKKP
jgi:hypothetical protein